MAKHAEAGDIRLMINPVTLMVAILILAAVGLISGMVPASALPASTRSKLCATNSGA